MDLQTALQIFGIEASEIEDEKMLNFIFNRRKASLISQLNDDESNPFLEELNNAYEFLLEWVKNNEVQKHQKHDIENSLNVINQKNHFEAVSHHDVLSQFQVFNQHEMMQRICPRCGTKNPSEIEICISCENQIARNCPSCSFMVDIDSKICPQCKAVIHVADKQKYLFATEENVRMAKQRNETEINAKVAEEDYKRNIRFGIGVWILIIISCIGICALSIYFYSLYGPNY